MILGNGRLDQIISGLKEKDLRLGADNGDVGRKSLTKWEHWLSIRTEQVFLDPGYDHYLCLLNNELCFF